MNILLDTNVLLNDFFHRNPDFGFQRIQDPKQKEEVAQYRQVVHEALLFLSLQPEVKVWSSTVVLARFAAVLGDLLVPAEVVKDEMAYWLSNLALAECKAQDLLEAQVQMESANEPCDFDDYLTRLIGKTALIDAVLTSVPKPKTFFWPIVILKPEQVRLLTFGQEE